MPIAMNGAQIFISHAVGLRVSSIYLVAYAKQLDPKANSPLG
jgi:hypothetical protein